MQGHSPVRGALVSRRTTMMSGPEKKAFVEALVGAVLDEIGAVGMIRTKPAATKSTRKRKPSTRAAEG